MLEVKNVSRIYTNGETEMRALDNVSVNFRQNEFVSILGPSGSGKTTLLNIVGGLDHYTKGDVIIEGVSTKEYTDRDWDTYRNDRIGFIFQSYNLISHQTALANVELALTLSGVSSTERKRRAIEALKKVGLGQQLNKRPGQLSGGQMQRVAIARAIVNDPDIILADEPTGALDSKTSLQIMDILKEIAKDKLVIMVTHNADLAKQYSTRIINVKDGKIVSDTKPFDGKNQPADSNHHKYTSMSLLTALSLSKNNLMTKRGRTILTAIAGSIGIIGIALILGLANGVNKYTSNLTSKGSIGSNLSIQKTYMSDEYTPSNPDSAETSENSTPDNQITALNDFKDNSYVSKQQQIRHNDIKSLKTYLDQHQSELKNSVDSIYYNYDIDPQIYATDLDGNTVQVNPAKQSDALGALFGAQADNSEVTTDDLTTSAFKEFFTSTPYELISGSLPKDSSELVLVVDDKNELPLSVAYSLNLQDRTKLNQFVDDINHGRALNFDNVNYAYGDIIGKTYKVVIDENNNKTTNLKVVGIVKAKTADDPSGFMGYTPKLIENIITNSNGKYDIDEPVSIDIYPKSDGVKPEVIAFLDNYNNNAPEDSKIVYTDQAKLIADLLKSVVNMISYILIGAVAISLVVSSIMIGIITYISVLERTKEIGILRAIGASKKDIVRVFRAEAIIEGLFAGILGVVVSYLLCFATSTIVNATAHIEGIADLSVVHALILILISVALTVFAGAIPAKKASKKDPVEALRDE